jgi:hypothetical protein
MVQCSLQTRFSSCVVALPNFMRGTAASRNPYPARRNPQRATNFGKVPIAQKQLNCSNIYSQTSMHRHRRHHRRSRHYHKGNSHSRTDIPSPTILETRMPRNQIRRRNYVGKRNGRRDQNAQSERHDQSD